MSFKFMINSHILIHLLILYVMGINDWCEVNGVISWYNNVEKCFRDYWNCNKDTFIFGNGCCMGDIKTFEEITPGGNEYRIFQFIDYHVINLKTLFIREKYSYHSFYIQERARPDGLFVSVGCFNNETFCRKSVDNGKILGIDLHFKAISIYSDIKENIRIDNYITRIDKPPQLFIDGKEKPNYVEFLFKYLDIYGQQYSQLRFLFTGNVDEENVKVKYEKLINNKYFTGRSVCERNGYKRFLAVLDEKITGNVTTTCGCKRENDMEIIEDYNWTFPDCRYNSSLFDLDLTTDNLESQINVNVQISKWYSVIFSTFNNYFLNSISKTNSILTFEKFDMNQNTTVVFNINVLINNLQINSIGMYQFSYDLNVMNVVYNEEFKNAILFVIKGKLTNKNNVLSSCGFRAFYTNNDGYMCYCNYTQGTWDPSSENALYKGDCFNYTTQSELILQLKTDKYTLTDDQNWKQINVLDRTLTINGDHELIVSFIKLERDLLLYTKMTVKSEIQFVKNTHCIVKKGGSLAIEQNVQILLNDVTNNINYNGKIQIERGGVFECTKLSKAIRWLNTRPTDFCVELISFQTYQNRIFTLSNSIFIQNKLVRVCPNGVSLSQKTCCNFTGNNIDDYQSYENKVLHCPINTENATLVIKNKYLKQPSDFKGVFSQYYQNYKQITFEKKQNWNTQFNETKETILMISKNSLNKGNYKLLSGTSKLFLGTNFGFEISTQKLNSKSAQNDLVITSDTNYPCKSLEAKAVGNYNSMCLACNNSYYLFNNICSPISKYCDNIYTTKTYSICEECKLGYEANRNNCVQCGSQCQHCSNNKCVLCKRNYYFNNNGICTRTNDAKGNIVLYELQSIRKCIIGYYSSLVKCLPCSDNCIQCYNSTLCQICNTKSFLVENETSKFCEIQSNVELSSNTKVIFCKNSFYLNYEENVCENCSMKYGELCDSCDSKMCFNCSQNGIINAITGQCEVLSETSCQMTPNTFCTICATTNYSINSSGFCDINTNCLVSWKNENCQVCDEGYFHDVNNSCITIETQHDKCIKLTPEKDRCYQCKTGYYLSNNYCEKCFNNCIDCYNERQCLLCEDGYYLQDNGSCALISGISNHCNRLIKGGSSCALCDFKYFRNAKGMCEKCIESCANCNQNSTCLNCEKENYLLTDSTKCVSYEELVNCTSKSQSGCLLCDTGFYIDNQRCLPCNSKTDNCTECVQYGVCVLCEDSLILKGEKCIPMSGVSKCVEIVNSKCSKCSFWYIPESSGTSCNSRAVWWVIFISVLFIVIIILTLILLTLLLILKVLQHKRQEEERKKTCLFVMSSSNVKFMKTSNQEIVVNMKEIQFESDSFGDIKVGEETRELICVGNISKNTVKVQFSSKESNYKYSFRTQPKVIAIPKGKACEFEIFLTPNCSTKINDKILLFSANLKSGKTTEIQIQITAKTEISTKLDPDELIDNKKVGEGSFGIVYQGEFRGSDVAIKKMKEMNQSDKAIQEFEKEVAMLDKFRSEYIIHFYGAVFIPNKICIVTEFAQYGSVRDLMKHMKNEEIAVNMKVKLCLDASKGILYLHENGVLHRDIKPDNFLVFSLDSNDKVNAKLTDFGSARNVNQLVSNMTFTKGIGTPKYMAPEVLNKEKYTKGADVFSFAISMYEVFIWKDPFPKDKFIFPWSIADFISAGKRFERPEEIPIKLFDILNMMWEQNTQERCDIKETIEMLENYLN
ncbi:protein serine/threonine kinase, putative [Entamoeba invadens IP1]|uniref:Protein serine/threonine kinase, putative n=1 Tax=Entamoeba invadens IP1 TaxID=370355 RepID=A0A0A1U3L4_ENTIV|nr:protein serine/threonine kinase, putative [Entamoeba invadens IP1]ELP88684.1 protein serine/threonine kinase, putative [Entamoeba invadens IP1]|eukprot:XP_004255455.1 protein serine/threonine kinase, putative [Entamoeba invadens IP1]